MTQMNLTQKLLRAKTKIGHLWYLVRINVIFMPLGNVAYLIDKATNRSAKPNIMTPLQTLRYLKKTRQSCVRFGDGEMTVMRGRDHYFAKSNTELAAKLREITASDLPSLLVCLPEYAYYYPDDTPKHIKSSWNVHMLTARNEWRKILTPGKLYGSAFITRIHNFKTHALNQQLFDAWKELFYKQDIIIVEGAHTRFGVNNDLLAGAKSVRRILCPDSNAVAEYDRILQTCLSHTSKHVLFLVALGQTAKLLTYDLARKGQRTLDVGHLDINYEWFLRGKKCKVPGKTVMEVSGDNHYEVVDGLSAYEAQVIKKIF
jgi:glycosyltransferase family protein